MRAVEKVRLSLSTLLRSMSSSSASTTSQVQLLINAWKAALPSPEAEPKMERATCHCPASLQAAIAALTWGGQQQKIHILVEPKPVILIGFLQPLLIRNDCFCQNSNHPQVSRLTNLEFTHVSKSPWWHLPLYPGGAAVPKTSPRPNPGHRQWWGHCTWTCPGSTILCPVTPDPAWKLAKWINTSHQQEKERYQYQCHVNPPIGSSWQVHANPWHVHHVSSCKINPSLQKMLKWLNVTIPHKKSSVSWLTQLPSVTGYALLCFVKSIQSSQPLGAAATNGHEGCVDLLSGQLLAIGI